MCGRYRTHRRESALLPDFPHGYRQQIPVPVRVAAQPGPGVVEVVVRHQHLCPVRAHHPGGGRQVPGSVVPGVKRLAAAAAAAAVPPGPVPPGHSRGDTLLIPPAASHVSSFLLRWLHCTTAPVQKGSHCCRETLHPLRHKELGGAAQKVSNDSWKLFTVSCCKSLSVYANL